MVVLPYSIVGAPQLLLAVRAAAGDPMQLLNPVRAEVRAIDAEQPLGRPITLSEVLGQEVVQPRFTMAMFSTFAGLGLVLAAVGIYSVLSFHVSRHTHELGVRMALGAPRRRVLGLMLGMGARLVLAGLAIGLVASVAATRLLRNQLFGVQADRSARLRRGDPRARRDHVPRLLPAGAPRRRRRSDGGAAAGLTLSGTPDAGSRIAVR